MILGDTHSVGYKKLLHIVWREFNKVLNGTQLEFQKVLALCGPYSSIRFYTAPYGSIRLCGSIPGDCLQTSQSSWCTSDMRAWSWSWLWMSQTPPCSRRTEHARGPLEPDKRRKATVSNNSENPGLGHTWFRTLSSIAASCSTNKVSWRVKLCSGCCCSFEVFSEFAPAPAELLSSFHTCTLDSLLSGLLGGVFITPGSGLLAPAAWCPFWSASQLEVCWAVCARAKGTPAEFTGLVQDGGLLSPEKTTILSHSDLEGS